MDAENLAKRMYADWRKERGNEDLVYYGELSPSEIKWLLFNVKYIEKYRKQILKKIKDAFLNKEELAEHKNGCWVIRKIKNLS